MYVLFLKCLELKIITEVLKWTVSGRRILLPHFMENSSFVVTHPWLPSGVCLGLGLASGSTGGAPCRHAGQTQHVRSPPGRTRPLGEARGTQAS